MNLTKESATEVISILAAVGKTHNTNAEPFINAFVRLKGFLSPQQPEKVAPKSGVKIDLGDGVNLNSILENLEVEYLKTALMTSGGNFKVAAESLGLARTTFNEKMKRYNIRRVDVDQSLPNRLDCNAGENHRQRAGSIAM